MKNVYSFDVFDTCLCRLCGEPRLMFDVLSLKVQKAMGEECTEHMRQLFVATRATAGGKDLTEIYNNIAQHYPLPLSVENMVQLELDIERQMLVPIHATLQLVNRLRDKGDILFISDMYLPSAFIRERLVEHGFFRKGDRLYVSDELGAWKYDGSLYKLIHEREGIPYRQWHHYGDNRHSDYIIPRRLGIYAHHLHYDYLHYEEQWRQKPVLQYQYPAILAGVARATRLSSDAPDDQKAFVCDVSASLMVSWVLHIMSDAQQHGIRRLFFCARDMHTQYHVALRLQSLFPKTTPLYLFISREALGNGDDKALIAYLHTEGVLSSEAAAIVDSNSTCHSLHLLNHIAQIEGKHPLRGYYLVAKAIPDDAIHATAVMSPTYLESMGNSHNRQLPGMKLLYELILSLNYHLKTTGYTIRNDKARPLLGEDHDDCWLMRDGTQQAKHNNDHLAETMADAFIATGLYHYSSNLLDEIAIPTLSNFVRQPHKEYLNYLHRFIWWGKPFVGALWGKGKGVWKRGSLFYSLPSLITTPLRDILSDDKKCRRLNRMLTWKIRN